MESAQLLADGPSGEIRLRLPSLSALFQAPAVDPLAGEFSGKSGFDWLQTALKRGWKGRADTTILEVLLPELEATAANQARAQTALVARAIALAEEAAGDLLFLEKQRIRAWIKGGIFFAVCLFLATAMERAPFSEFTRSLLSETIIIAGWVGLWHPLDLTLYAWWPPRFRQEIYGHIAKMKLILKADR